MQTVIHRIMRAAILFSIVLVLSIPPAKAAGLLKPLQGPDDALSLKSHDVTVVINNGYAKTEVDQVFFNGGDQDLEATYTFPVPKDASLSEVSLFIDEREIIGEVLEKKRARKVYDDQKQKGKRTAIAEKESFYHFQVRVYPVRANDETRVRLVYYQPLEIDLNVGRYVYPLEEGGTDEERINFWTVDDTISERFRFHADLKSAYPIEDIRVPGHEAEAVIQSVPDNQAESGQAHFTITLEKARGGNLSRDIVLYYRLRDDTPARVEVVPYRAPGEDGYVMVVVTPGGILQPIDQGTDWTFVLDISGSMQGEKIRTLAQGVVKTIRKMKPEDRFRIVTFSDRAKDFSRGYLAATPENVQDMIGRVSTLQTGGSTALYAGLEKAYKGMDHDRTTGIILVTDGVANDGPSRNIDILKLHRQYDVRLFTFVIGNSANQPLLSALARESGGFAMNISSSDDIIGRILQAKAKILHQSLYDTNLKLKGTHITDLTPAVFGNLHKGQQLILFGKYSQAGEVEVEMKGRLNGENRSWKTRTMLPEEALDNPEIKRLWALSSIQEIGDQIEEQGESDKLIGKIQKLGTDYSLVTDYTAMVVLDDSEKEQYGIGNRNAEQVKTERQAQTRKTAAPVKSYRVDHQDAQPVFKDSPSPGIGSGPVGPFFIGLALWLRRRQKH